MKKLATVLLALVMALGLVGCATGGNEAVTTVGGTIKCNGVGLEGVSIMVDGQSAATTDESGVFSLGEYTEAKTITPVKEGYTFMPQTLTVKFARPDADFTAYSTSSDEELPPEVEQNDKTRIPAPTDGSLYDDFSNGISPKGKWDIVSKKWGAPEFQGCVTNNVQYTEDGILVLRSKGRYYKSASERCTGASIVSKEALGPGKYEVAAKISPRLGMCTAIWTFYYENENVNHEIDIEFPGALSLDRVMNTTWTSETATTTKTVNLNELNGLGAQNDGKWHKYGFEWSVEKNEIKWYIDDVLTFTATANIPSIKGQLWIGIWEPIGWAGEPNYETSDFLVDWVAYTPFNETEGVREANPEYLEKNVAGEGSFPKAPIEIDENSVDIVSNGSFDGMAAAWTQEKDSDLRSGIVPADYFNSSKAYRLFGDTTVSQTISCVYEGFEYRISGKGRIASGTSGKAFLLVEFLDESGAVIGTANKYDLEAGSEFAAFSGTVTAPQGTCDMRVKLVSEGVGTVAYFGEVKMTRVIDLIGEVS